MGRAGSCQGAIFARDLRRLGYQDVQDVMCTVAVSGVQLQAAALPLGGPQQQGGKDSGQLQCDYPTLGGVPMQEGKQAGEHLLTARVCLHMRKTRWSCRDTN